jgi:hypothetical protein
MRSARNTMGMGGPHSDTHDLWHWWWNGQVILVWVRASGIKNASHPRRLRVTRVRPWAMHSLGRVNPRMLKTPQLEVWVRRYGNLSGPRTEPWTSGSRVANVQTIIISSKLAWMGVSEVCINICVKCRWTSSDCLLHSKTTCGSFGGLKL